MASLHFRKIAAFVTLFQAVTLFSHAQKHYEFRDSLDHKLDLSDWVLKAHGFIPVPYLITEPALGNIGFATAPVFITPNAPYLDSVKGKLVRTRVKPNIYAAAFAVTGNGSILGAVAGMGEIRRWRTHYQLAAAYGDIYMNFYQADATGAEHPFEFRIRALPVFGQLTKTIARSPWSAGINYLFLQTEQMRSSADYYSPKGTSGVISRAGIVADYDRRDNIFTPNKGIRWKTQYAVSDQSIGSDYNYSALTSTGYLYVPVFKSIVAGLRLEYQQLWGDAPFYMLPYISLRGIPVMRYQGRLITLGETEWRWDFTSRHSMVAFGGVAKAVRAESSWADAPWHASGGGGYRYLLARRLGLRVGLDIAHGPEQWAYYVVFGTNWAR